MTAFLFNDLINNRKLTANDKPDVARLVALPRSVFAAALAKAALIIKDILACVWELVCVVMVHEQLVGCDVSAHASFFMQKCCVGGSSRGPPLPPGAIGAGA